jgi:hypothetical protein
MKAYCIPERAFICTLENPNPSNSLIKSLFPSNASWQRLWHKWAANLQKNSMLENVEQRGSDRIKIVWIVWCISPLVTGSCNSPKQFRHILTNTSLLPHNWSILAVHFSQLLHPFFWSIPRSSFFIRSKQHPPLNPTVLRWQYLQQP